MIRPVYVDINIKYLQNNFNLIKKLCPLRKIWLVVKANAYGHGIKNIYPFIYYLTDGFAVISIEEGLLLRKLGFKKPILLLSGYFDLDELKLCYKFNFTVVIHSYWQINILKQITSFNKIDVYLKLNNIFLNRLGFNIKNLKKSYLLLKSLNIINSISLMCHLYNDNYDYLLIYNEIKRLNLFFSALSFFSSSKLIWDFNNINTSWVRIGILLYGISPNKNLNIFHYGFKPVMSFKSKIISIRKIKLGQFVGYNNSYCTNTNRLIAILPCGYADGYPRQSFCRNPVLVDNYLKSKILGSIYMDMMTIDLYKYINVKIGSYVELWGENICIDYIAELAGTISYHLICSINHLRVNFRLVL